MRVNRLSSGAKKRPETNSSLEFFLSFQYKANVSSLNTAVNKFNVHQSLITVVYLINFHNCHGYHISQYSSDIAIAILIAFTFSLL